MFRALSKPRGADLLGLLLILTFFAAALIITHSVITRRYALLTNPAKLGNQRQFLPPKGRAVNPADDLLPVKKQMQQYQDQDIAKSRADNETSYEKNPDEHISDGDEVGDDDIEEYDDDDTQYQEGEYGVHNEEEDEKSGGFFGFFENVENSEWLKPFQRSASTFRDPPPARWDAAGVLDNEEDDNNDNDNDEDIENDGDDSVGQGVYNKKYVSSLRGGDEMGVETGENERELDKRKYNQIERGDNTMGGAVKFKPDGVRESDASGVSSIEKQRTSAGDAQKPKQKTKAGGKPGETGVSKSLYKIPRIDEETLLRVFEDKLKNITGKERGVGETCYNKRTISNSCDDDRCQRLKLPAKPQERIKQLIDPPGLKLTDSQHALLQEMASKVQNSYDVILLTTASSNHFFESQALLKNLHANVFPVMKNFTLLFYDIGLAPDEREQMEKFCRCQVLSFPFDKLPDHVRNLKCYAWKPLMIKAHIRQANVVLWMDASIRFNGKTGQLQEFVQRVKDRGVQIGSSNCDSTFRTFRSMYHYFGDEPCMYLGMGQAKATIAGYRNEPFVERVILEPWAACGLNQECMCPRNNKSAGCYSSKQMAKNYVYRNGPIIYGLCHRFDQSAISLILHKLYQSKRAWVMTNLRMYGDIRRDEKIDYFRNIKH